MPADLELVRQLSVAANHLAVCSVSRRDGSVHASLVNAGVINDPFTAEPSVGVVVAGASVKLRHFRRAGRATVVFQAGYQWVAVEGAVNIAGPDDLELTGAATVPRLVREIFVAAGGDHDNWAAFDRVMADERRAAVYIRADRISTNA
jgi:hypothetical protein